MTIVSASVARVPFPLPCETIEGLMDDGESFYVAVPQICTLFSIPNKHASRDIKKLLGVSEPFIKIQTNLHSRPVNVLTVEQFQNLCYVLATKKNPIAYKIVHGVDLPKNKTSNQLEKEISKKLSYVENGETEVICPIGRIDILTSTHLIEVKEAKAWKSGLGQLLTYGYYYPSHILRLHLFGALHSESKGLIEKHCSRLNIKVTYE